MPAAVEKSKEGAEPRPATGEPPREVDPDWQTKLDVARAAYRIGQEKLKGKAPALALRRRG